MQMRVLKLVSESSVECPAFGPTSGKEFNPALVGSCLGACEIRSAPGLHAENPKRWTALVHHLDDLLRHRPRSISLTRSPGIFSGTPAFVDP
jgi:hypothetical protein